MKHLPTPLKQILDERAPREAIDEGWQEVQARIRGRRRARRAISILAPALVALLAILVLVHDRLSRGPRPLSRDDGSPLLGKLAAPDHGRERIALSDGSSLVLFSGAELELKESSPERIQWVLRKGALELDVRSFGQRTWLVDCGWITIEVAGTRLSIERSPSEVVVTVLEGTVRAIDERATPKVQFLSAPARLVAANPEIARVEPNREGPRLVGSSSSAIKKRRASPAVKAEPPPTKEEEVDLLQDADRARAEGRPRDALPILERCIDGGGPKGAIAAFTLGRVLLEDLSEPARAAEAFERALALPLPDELVESAYARIVEAHHRAHDPERARSRGEDYLERFPNGLHRTRVVEWMSR